MMRRQREGKQPSREGAMIDRSEGGESRINVQEFLPPSVTICQKIMRTPKKNGNSRRASGLSTGRESGLEPHGKEVPKERGPAGGVVKKNSKSLLRKKGWAKIKEGGGSEEAKTSMGNEEQKRQLGGGTGELQRKKKAQS